MGGALFSLHGTVLLCPQLCVLLVVVIFIYCFVTIHVITFSNYLYDVYDIFMAEVADYY